MTPTAPTDTRTDAELLSAAITASGLSVRGFAREHVPNLNIRSVWRHLKGEFAMPEGVRAKCEAILKAKS